MQIPVPFFNIINGGVHAGNLLPFQELMVAPIGAKSFEEALRMGSEVYYSLKKLLLDNYGRVGTFLSFLSYKRGR